MMQRRASIPCMPILGRARLGGSRPWIPGSGGSYSCGHTQSPLGI
uniref:Uncharacterized protein n=1 Tax=Arundo donax TaxID=35708 RepID=A0A0A9E8Z8_ARUDO